MRPRPGIKHQADQLRVVQTTSEPDATADPSSGSDPRENSDACGEVFALWNNGRSNCFGGRFRPCVVDSEDLRVQSCLGNRLKVIGVEFHRERLSVLCQFSV
jgi:hypothetical protein